MRISWWDGLVVGLTALITGGGFAVRDSSAASLPVGVMWGLILGSLFCILVRLVTAPVARELSALRERVAELERRGDGSGSARS